MEQDFANYGATQQEEQQQPKSTLGSQFIEFIQTLVVFAAIGTAIYLFVAQPHKVSGSSMYPNFHDGDYIITNKISYRFNPPERGDIVVFKNPKDQSQDFIKRIVGVPGDKVKVEKGLVFLNGKVLKEPYISSEITTEGGAFLADGNEVTVPSDHYLVLGDNRNRSSDSREWGYITKEEIIGKVILRYWPQDVVGLYPAAYQIPNQ